MYYGGDRFRWMDYLHQQKAAAAPKLLFKSKETDVDFQILVGMGVEALGLVEFYLICVATISFKWLVDSCESISMAVLMFTTNGWMQRRRSSTLSEDETAAEI